jgi:hypothetical protein
LLNNAAGQRFHNHSPLTFEKLKRAGQHREAPRQLSQRVLG